MQTVMYLRKSRADLEAEQNGAGDTLSRHRSALYHTAACLQLQIGAVYEEVVSGDTIAARPRMQQLLREVEAGLWEAVLVMEIERLARGDPIDQGIVARAFRYSQTKIITPLKTYNPENEFDEEFLEFGLFMSRREYKTIRRRLTAGVQASRREGKYTGSVAPYGYTRQKLTGEKGYTLRPDPAAAATVQDIYHWFVQDGLHASAIAQRLHALGISRPQHSKWTAKAVSNILQNPHYAGYTTSTRRPSKPAIRDGTVTITRPRLTDITFYDGRHPALIPPDLWHRAQKQHLPCSNTKELENSYAGILLCAACGTPMRRGSYGTNSTRRPYLFCPNKGCSAVSSSYGLVEQLIATALQELSLPLHPKDHTAEHIALHKRALAALEKQYNDLLLRENRAFELAEMNIYAPEVFTARMEALSHEKQVLSEQIIALRQTVAGLHALGQPTKYSTLYALYEQLSISQRNRLLSALFHKIEYKKTHKAKAGDAGGLSLTLYPRIPLQK